MATPKTAVATPDPEQPSERALYLGDDVVSDPEADARAIAARILNATTAEEIFGGPGTLLSAEDIIGKPFTLNGADYRDSDFEGGAGAYAILHVVPWGETSEVMVTCGARNVMAAAFRANQLGLLPRGPVQIVQGKQTRKGFTPLWLQDMTKKDADNSTDVIDTGAVEEPFS